MFGMGFPKALTVNESVISISSTKKKHKEKKGEKNH